MHTAPDRQFGYVVSDLHLFTHRTAAGAHLSALRGAADKAEFFVLNGDIFDFRWTTLASAEATAQAAEEELERAVRRYPNCRFHYIMGNHDGLAWFARHLDALAERAENFHWHPSHLLVGDSLFLHGDLALGNGRRDPLQRTLKQLPRKPSRGLHAAYEVLVASRAHRAVAGLHSPTWCAKRILKSLRAHHPALAPRLRDVYFGHSHHPFSNFRYQGVRFHNTGSTIRHLRCNLLEVQS